MASSSATGEMREMETAGFSDRTMKAVAGLEAGRIQIPSAGNSCSRLPNPNR